MSDPAAPAVVVSAGFSKTHMTTAAREVLDRGQLAIAITGAYPTERLERLARRAGVADRGQVPRWLERGEGIPDRRLRALTLPELLFAPVVRLLAHRRSTAGLAQRLAAATWRLYGRLAGRELRRLAGGAQVYHFRAGYGQASIDEARARGMRVVCDQALVHPLVLDALVAARGRMPELGGQELDALERRLGAVDRAVLDDIRRSDCVLVNSDFVKQTFLACGWPEELVRVVYLGVDENFLAGVRPSVRQPADGPLRLLFAGRFERRKGAEVLVEALSRLDGLPWELVLAGPILPGVEAEHRAFLADPRVTALGSIRRDALAEQMLRAQVLVFPTYAEGSARVVFEAMACGCCVITTPNAGSVVEDGVHGSLVAPGDAGALAAALLAAGADRARVAQIGNCNAALVRARYRQSDYGDDLAALYRDLVRGEIAPAPAPAMAPV